jgi:hypothetical protein
MYIACLLDTCVLQQTRPRPCHARANVRTNSSKVRPQLVASHLRQSLSRRGETFLGVRTRERDTAAAVSAVCVLYSTNINEYMLYIITLEDNRRVRTQCCIRVGV